MLKMYFLVLYNLSPIQQGIQAGHAAVEYMTLFFPPGIDEHTSNNVANCYEWATRDKTFIILNGGTTKTMSEHKAYLDKMQFSYVTFQEPDLDNVITAIAFIGRDDDPTVKYFTNNFRLA